MNSDEALTAMLWIVLSIILAVLIVSCAAFDGQGNMTTQEAEAISEILGDE